MKQIKLSKKLKNLILEFDYDKNDIIDTIEFLREMVKESIKELERKIK